VEQITLCSMLKPSASTSRFHWNTQSHKHD
jgi:hypothetical protein